MLLMNVPLFSDLGKAELELLEHHAVNLQFPKNTMIINEGDESNALYAILEGKVKAYLSDDEGKEIILATYGPGEYFGEMGLFDNAPRSASVITLETSRLVLISKADFEHCLKQNIRVALQIIHGLNQRLRTATENMRNLALLDVYGRVAKLLPQLAEPEGDQLVVKERLTQQDIADRVGSSREMISRILKDLKEGGYIKIEGKQITIRDKLPASW